VSGSGAGGTGNESFYQAVQVYRLSAWPDLIVGLGIFFLNLDAAREVYLAAHHEKASAAL